MSRDLTPCAHVLGPRESARMYCARSPDKSTSGGSERDLAVPESAAQRGHPRNTKHRVGGRLSLHASPHAAGMTPPWLGIHMHILVKCWCAMATVAIVSLTGAGP